MSINDKYPFEVFGYEVDDGWKPIVYKLIEDIKKINPDIKVLQVKEKFGGLRVYLSDYNKDIDKLISDAEVLAIKTCELCGSVDDTVKLKTLGTGCIKTVCVKCFKSK